MTEHLLLISLGPVQDFIASARRCQDLWFGSWLLSDLSRATAEGVKSITPGFDPLIFPAGLDAADKPAVANKILAVLPAGQKPKTVAEIALSAMKQRLNKVSSDAFNRIEKHHFHQKLAEQQLNDLMEMIWVAVPITQNYATARDQAEGLLAARKNTRNWGPVPWHGLAGDGVPKSSLDGIRESVIDEQAYKDFATKPEQLRTKYFVKAGERLCGVGLLKRLGTEPDFDADGQLFRRRRPVFHSTSHVASAPILARLKHMGTPGEQAAHQYLDTLQSLGVDVNRFQIAAGTMSHATVCDPRDAGHDEISAPRTFTAKNIKGLDGYLFFEGRLPELLTDYCANAGSVADPAKLKQARSALGAFRKAIGLRENHTTYYAYLLADGDHMGKAIDALAKLPDGIEQHRHLGRALEAFSAKCGELTEKAGGSLVYAGGDDVLALCPLHTALSLARTLRNCFASHMADVFKPDFHVPTLSVGLGISHHLDSMEQARALAKQAETAAKDAGRNALAIVVSKRSGGTTQVVRKWSDDDESLDRWLVALSGWLSRGELPDGLAFDLERLVAPFEISFGERPDPTQVGEAVLALAQGIIKRKRAHDGDAELPEGLKKCLADALSKPDSKKAVSQLSDEIQVARLFLSAFDDAFGELPKEAVQ